MPTSRAFAYNPSLSAPTGATQFGNLAIQSTGWTAGSGALTWFNGPDEDLGYVIGYSYGGPKTSGSVSQVVSGTSVGFRRTTTFSDAAFLSTVLNLTGQSFLTASNAVTYLNSNGYWVSYSPVVANLTLRLDASNSASYPGTGTTWTDLAPPQQNITLVGSPTYTSGTPAYFTFNGTSQRGSGSSGTGVLPQTQYTKSVWFYLNANADNNLVSSDTGGHFMYFASGNKLLCGHSNWPIFGAYPSTATFSLNTWYYAALTFNTTDGMKLYVNGNLDSTYTANKAAHSGDGSVNIAAYGAGNFLNGRIAKVYCYDRTLTAGEVLQNYNADKSNFGY